VWRRQFFELVEQLFARGQLLILQHIDAGHDQRIVQLEWDPAGTWRG
jgi:hypothetical protein